MSRWRQLARLLVRLRPRHALALPPLLLHLLARAAAARRRNLSPAREFAALDWGRGVSVVIPERAGGEMLARCLARLEQARAALDEPSEVIVVVNGSDPADYAALAERHPELRWQFHPQPLGFTRAVIHGAAAARYGSVYLLNNDMMLEPQALAALLPVRAPQVFAIASQIQFPPGRRREETGWTQFRHEQGLPVPFHVPPPDRCLRGTVWAGAGAALFQAELLRRLLPDARAFDPFYWEDVDLGLRAWRLGYGSLICPDSQVEHGHRVTVQRFFAATEVERIFERNRLQLLLRHPALDCGRVALLRRLLALDARSLRELAAPWRLAGLLRCLREGLRAPAASTTPTTMATLLTTRPATPARPCVILVSPFALLPPRHGGAVRSLELARALAVDFEVVLLSDEAERYPDAAPWLAHPFAAIHLVGGRPPERGAGRIARLRSHAHRALRSELRRLVDGRRPQAVLVEHMELGGLIDTPTRHRPRWLLSLQDVLLAADDPAQRAADRAELACMDRYDALIVASPEDQALLGARPSWLIGNGIDPQWAAGYRPSQGLRNLLFVGPFRAPINRLGIAAFVAEVYPRLRERVADLQLTVVGGIGAPAAAARLAGFDAPGIRVLEQVDDMAELIRCHAATINPQPTLRGSSLKVLESLAAGRVCVSTVAGARGRLQAGFRGLLAVESLADFVEPLARLLSDECHRLALEAPQPELLAQHGWVREGAALRQRLHTLLAGHAG